MYQPPPGQQGQYQPQFYQPRRSNKRAALWMFANSWEAGAVGVFCTFSFMLACVGFPLLAIALACHIAGFVFLAMVEGRP